MILTFVLIVCNPRMPSVAPPRYGFAPNDWKKIKRIGKSLFLTNWSRAEQSSEADRDIIIITAGLPSIMAPQKLLSPLFKSPLKTYCGGVEARMGNDREII